MPYFANKEDERTSQAIERWKLTAADEVDQIGGWRDADPWRLANEYWPRIGRGSRGVHQSTMDGRLFHDTTHLVRRIVNDYQRLDPAPLQEVYDAIAAWHEDHTAERVPPQRELFATLERAMMVVLVVEEDLMSRLRSSPPGEDKNEASAAPAVSPRRKRRRRRQRKPKASRPPRRKDKHTWLRYQQLGSYQEVADELGIGKTTVADRCKKVDAYIAATGASKDSIRAAVSLESRGTDAGARPLR